VAIGPDVADGPDVAEGTAEQGLNVSGISPEQFMISFASDFLLILDSSSYPGLHSRDMVILPQETILRFIVAKRVSEVEDRSISNGSYPEIRYYYLFLKVRSGKKKYRIQHLLHC